jgi:putative phage-type endonuclease
MTRKQWLKLRQQSVGASEAAALFDLHPYHSRYSLWAEKTGQVEAPDESTDQQEYGLIIEPYLAKRYARETGRAVEKFPKHTVFKAGRASATPDRKWKEAIEDGSPEAVRVMGAGPLELKTGIFFNPSEDLPAHWLIQIQQQLLCMGGELGAFAILGSYNRFFVADVERNDPFISLLVEKVEEFWDFVTRGVPPPVDGHAATREALKRLHPKDNGTTVSLPAEAEAWTSELKMAKWELDGLKKKQDLLENRLRAAIGDATYGVLPDGTHWSLKTTQRAGYTVEPTEYRQLRRSEKRLLTA